MDTLSLPTQKIVATAEETMRLWEAMKSVAEWINRFHQKPGLHHEHQIELLSIANQLLASPPIIAPAMISDYGLAGSKKNSQRDAQRKYRQKKRTEEKQKAQQETQLHHALATTEELFEKICYKDWIERGGKKEIWQQKYDEILSLAKTGVRVDELICKFQLGIEI